MNAMCRILFPTATIAHHAPRHIASPCLSLVNWVPLRARSRTGSVAHCPYTCARSRASRPIRRARGPYRPNSLAVAPSQSAPCQCRSPPAATRPPREPRPRGSTAVSRKLPSTSRRSRSTSACRICIQRSRGRWLASSPSAGFSVIDPTSPACIAARPVACPPLPSRLSARPADAHRTCPADPSGCRRCTGGRAVGTTLPVSGPARSSAAPGRSAPASPASPNFA